MVQLSEKEAEIYKDCPVVLDFSSGFYIFPVSLDVEGTFQIAFFLMRFPSSLMKQMS